MNINAAAHILAPDALRPAVILSGTGSTEDTVDVTPNGCLYAIKNGANAILVAFSKASADATYVDTTNGVPIGPYELFPFIADENSSRIHAEAYDGGAVAFYAAVWQASPEG